MRIKATAPENTVYVEAWSRTEEVGFLNMLLEEHEGLAVMRTLDRVSGHLKFWVPRSRLDDFRMVLDDFIDRGWMDRYTVFENWWDLPDALSPQPPNPT